MPDVPEQVNVALLMPVGAEEEERVRSIAPERLRVTQVWAGLLDEIRREWSPELVAQYMESGPERPELSPDESERRLREAHVVLLGFPYPHTLSSRTPNLRWLHYPMAGMSDLRDTDLWGIPATVTCARGRTAALPIAEVVMGAVSMFAKGLHRAATNTQRGRFLPQDYAMTLVHGKTMGIIGLGGIGGQVARLARCAGMRTLATRRSATRHQADVEGVDGLFPTSELHAMLAESDYVAVCAMLTTETEGLLDSRAFGAMKPGAHLINIARGGIVQEPALIEALRSGRLAGAYLDVYAGDPVHPPDPALAALPNVVITPHIADQSDVPQSFGVELFRENLRRFLDGEPLENVVDWQRGY